MSLLVASTFKRFVLDAAVGGLVMAVIVRRLAGRASDVAVLRAVATVPAQVRRATPVRPAQTGDARGCVVS